MTDTNIAATSENSDNIFNHAIKILDELIGMFSTSGSPHAKTIMIALQGVSMLASYIYAEHVKK